MLFEQEKENPMEQQQEKIREAVESFRQDMLDFWKDLINFQAGSKEKDRMQTLMEKVSAYLERQGMESELVESEIGRASCRERV